jgi:hypothetical protein
MFSSKHVVPRGSSLTRNLKTGEIAEIFAIHASAAEHIHHIVDQGSAVAFSGNWDETNAFEFCPGPSGDVETPRIIVMILAIRASEDKKLVAIG